MSFGGGSSNTMSGQDSRILSLTVSQSTYATTIARIYGKIRVSGNILWYGDFTAHEHKTTTHVGKGGGGGGGQTSVSYTYSASLMLALGSGTISSVPTVWIEKEKHTLGSLGFELHSGALGQGVWPYLASAHPAEAFPYSGIAYVASANYDMGDTASTPQWSFECVGNLSSEADGDAKPADVINDIWSDPVEGLAQDGGVIADTTGYASWCAANGFAVSIAADTQKEARAYIQDVLDATMAVAVPSQGKIKIVPLGDEAVGSWSPDNTICAEFTEDDFLEVPTLSRTQPRDACNRVTLEYKSRANDYNTLSTSASDLTHVNQYGANTSSLTLHCITRDAMATSVANATLNRGLYIRLTARIRVDQRFCLLEPMDLVTLTYPAKGLNQKVMRVVEIEEDEDGDLSLTLEEWPFGVAQPRPRNSQDTGGYVPNYNVLPGSANTPVIFEPPVSLAGGSQIWLATSGGSNWGGANVWISLDGDSYSRIGTISRAARHGILTAAYPQASDPDTANTLAVDISVSSGQLTPVTAAVRDLFESLCFVGNAAGGELVAYQGAALTGVGRYNLTACRRGAYGTQPAAHATGDQFARLDGAQFRYSYDPALIGKTLYIKLQSFNRFNANLQDLAEVAPLAYVVKGAPLGTVAGLVLETPFTGASFAVKWDAYPGATGYTLRLYANNVLRKELSTHDTRLAVSVQQLVAWGIGRTVELRIIATAANGQSTEPAVLIATKPQCVAPTVAVQDTAESMIVTASQSSDAAYQATRICISQTEGFDPAAATPYYDGPQTAYPSGKIAAGTWYVRVCQYDQFGPDNLNWSSEMAVPVAVQAIGVVRVTDASQIKASAGSEPPGGSAYWAVYDNKTWRMAMWDKTTGAYVFAASESEIAALLAAATKTISDEVVPAAVASAWVGGANLMPNSGMETDVAGWRITSERLIVDNSGALLDAVLAMIGPNESVLTTQSSQLLADAANGAILVIK